MSSTMAYCRVICALCYSSPERDQAKSYISDEKMTRRQAPLVPKLQLGNEGRGSPPLHDFACGVVAGDAHDAAAGVGCGAAQEEVADRGAVVGVADDWPAQEQLVQVHRSLEDIAAGKAESFFHIERRDDLAVHDR